MAATHLRGGDALDAMRNSIEAGRLEGVGKLCGRPAVMLKPRGVLSADVDATTMMMALFPCMNDAQCAQLEAAMQRLPLPDRAARDKLTCALAAATGGSVVLALKVMLRAMACFDVTAAKVPTVIGPQPVESAMWRLAQLLARTEGGFALLRQMHPANGAMGRA
ncbi:MAG: hypothetical protein H7327_15440, partial [Herminiimonas sp.]|nr:hypothetical protein [Herminiimonas sp.]